MSCLSVRRWHHSCPACLSCQVSWPSAYVSCFCVACPDSLLFPPCVCCLSSYLSQLVCFNLFAWVCYLNSACMFFLPILPVFFLFRMFFLPIPPLFLQFRSLFCLFRLFFNLFHLLICLFHPLFFLFRQLFCLFRLFRFLFRLLFCLFRPLFCQFRLLFFLFRLFLCLYSL